MDKIVLSQIIKNKKLYPSKLAIADSVDGFLTYEELYLRIKACAFNLEKEGIKRNDKVMLCGISRKEYVISYFAIHMLGAIAVPYEKGINKDTLEYMEKFVQAKVNLSNNEKEISTIKTLSIYEVCMGNEYYNKDILNKEQNIADILFTTGTTGKPKGVVMTHKNIYLGAENVACGVEMVEEDIDMIVAPMNHAYAMGCLRAAMIRGAGVILHESCVLLKDMMKKIEKYHCTGFSTVPASIKLLHQYTRGSLNRILGGMRYIELGSSSLDPESKKDLLNLLPNANIYLNYGSTEAPRNIYMDLRKFPDKLKTIGKAAVNSKVYIMDEEGKILPVGKSNIGRLVIQGDMVMPSYWEDEENSRKVLQGNCFLTNDIGYIDEDGFVYLMGRKNDLLNIGGELVSPIEIENIANRMKVIETSACVAVKDETELLGEKIVLFVQSNEVYEKIEEDIMQFLKDNLPAKKVPQKIKLIKKMPTNYVGKIDRKQLEKEY